ncbi:unnamed protein product, partial [Polarella glacialis]
RFLANFLLSSCDFINPVNRAALRRDDCVVLDCHLKEHHWDDPLQSVADAFDLFQMHGSGGSVGVRREATAVLQHLFTFRSARETDARGRAINFNDGGLTVIDDDDILVPPVAAALSSAFQASREPDLGPADQDALFPALPG